MTEDGVILQTTHTPGSSDSPSGWQSNVNYRAEPSPKP